ncbi:thiamine phosphate synthase [Marinomonas algarum]|uniref:Thiamine-phosphate synthase n=1 Tax=Marinomonas algarum TaxID=2883105 RepID=A0A9X1LE44_9GAMM|nr:thiamine phosphate synthase [Marinomonas algarum]MCB5160873.1 thiamine phosphate synthase [Marinomonas algarum]
MMNTLDTFYPVFDSYEWLERLVPLGIKLVQLRVKDRPLEEVRTQIQKSKQLCEKYDCQLVVNDYWQLAIEEGCDFVHLGQEDLDDADIGAIQRAGLKLGISTHCQEELERALQYQPTYIALGPVYPTILKKMKWHQQGLETVSQWKAQLETTPLVGIGGISVERAQGVLDAGADVVAAVTDITLNADPEARIAQWLRATR